jgi:hypothetical protein
MSLPPTLYKFSDAAGALGILSSQCLRTKSPLDFNDPFEAFPSYDEERKNYMIATRREFYARFGQPGIGSLTAEGNEEDIPVESWVGLNAQQHDQFFERVYALYRVLCFSKAPTATLLWSHYASSHRGIAIGFDLTSTVFPKGQIPEGIHVKYREDRRDHLLPVDYYRHNGLNAFYTPPEGFSMLHDGTLIRIEDHNALYVESLIKILSSKHDPWKYEEELRLLYNLAKPDQDGLDHESDHDVARITPEMITEVIFGYHCPVSEIEVTAELLKDRYPFAKLGYVDLHPYEYKVRVHYGDLKQILTTQKMRLEHSFRARIR